MNKTISVLFGCWLLALSTAQAQVFYTNTDGCVFTTTNGAVTITGYVGSGGALNIPSVINNLPVTGISAEAFEGLTNLTAVVIPDTVEGIGVAAFDSCANLASAFIPGSVESIGAEAFENCLSLTNATISLGVTSIASNAFSGCQNLPGVVVPNSVTNIGDYAFYGCQNLAGVTFGSNLLSIGQSAFSGNYSSFYDAHHAWLGDEACPLSNITLPDGVTNIGASAFQGCIGVNNIQIGAGLTSIGDGAFYNCYHLSSVVIGPNVTSIGASAFSGDGSYFGDGACPLTSVIIPNSVTTLGDHAFYNCHELARITLSSHLTSIGVGAFSGYDGGIEPPHMMILSCPLSDIIIPDSVTNIGDNAFYNCQILTSVTIGTHVTTIGGSAFSGDNYIWFTPNVIDPTDFACSLTSVSIPNSVTTIGDNAFNGCQYLTRITFGVNLRSIGDSAFSGAASAYPPLNYTCPLTSITIPDSVTNLGNYVFYSCDKLTSVTLGRGVENVGTGLFSGVSGEFPDNYHPVSVSNYACGLTSIVIPDSVTNIGPSAFYNCSSLRSATVGKSVVSIGNSAFSGGFYTLNSGTTFYNLACPIANLTILNSVTTIGDHAFYGCYDLGIVTFGNSVASIGASAFSGPLYSPVAGQMVSDACPLTSISLPASLVAIGSDAFSYCRNLHGDYFQGNAPAADGTQFYGNPSDATVYYLPGTTGWGTTFGGIPTAPWTLPNPTILPGSLWVGSGYAFGFTISWATNLSVVIEASTDPAGAVWQPVRTNALFNGVFYFHDPEWTNYPARFYRVRSL